MCYTGVGRHGKVRPSLTNEVEADKLFPVFEVFRFDSQVGFFIITLIGSGKFCISKKLCFRVMKLWNKHAILKIRLA